MIAIKSHLTLFYTLLYSGIALLEIATPTVEAQQIRKDLKYHPNWKILDRGDNCGYNSADRIIGGTKANLGQYPWIVRLGYGFDVGDDVEAFHCGGAIISDRYILSAAHCSPDDVGMELVKIRVGEYDASTDKDCVQGNCAPPVQDIDIEEVNCHDGYTSEGLHNDICLIRLAEPIKMNDYVQPICLPVYDNFEKDSMIGQKMEVAGWGVTNIETRQTSDVLMTLKVPVISHNNCVMYYAGKAVIIDKQICAGGVIGQDSCGGDSGGPLVKPFSIKAPPRYFIVGIVSFGPKHCARTATPGVYTKVSKYMNWILDNVRE